MEKKKSARGVGTHSLETECWKGHFGQMQSDSD
jgi:hypothetical protein